MGESIDTFVSECLARWRNHRDPEALGELLKWQRDRAYSIAWRVLGNVADAEDAVQKAFVKLLDRTQGFSSPDEFRVAVYRAVTQCALDAARANRVRGRLEKAMVQLERVDEASPQAAAERSEAVRLVFEELAALPEDARALVVLCYQEGLSVSDASEVLAVPRETLRARLARSLETLRQRVVRRGAALSLLLLAGILKENGAAASAELCEALDETLPGRSCKDIPTDAASFAPRVIPPPSFITFGAGAILTTAALIIAAVATWQWWPATDPMVEPSSAVAASNNGSTSSIQPAPRPRAPDASAVPAPQATPIEPLAAAKPAAARENAQKERAAPDAGGRPDGEFPLNELPAAVRSAAEAAQGGMELLEAERETQGARVTYEVKGRSRANGIVYEMKLSSTGKLTSLKQDDDDDGARVKKPRRDSAQRGEF